MIQMQDNFALRLPYKFRPLLRPMRYKVFWGGRGAAKSWSIARALIAKAHIHKIRIGCFRELQASIKDSVQRLIVDQIELMGLAPWFHITERSILSKVTGAEFIFKGLRHNAYEIKSTEGIDVAWVEEAQLVTKDSWNILIPTIRKENSEIWVSFNPVEETDDTYVRFVVKPPPDSYIVKVGWQDNKYFSATQEKERVHMMRTDPEGYQHVWEGHFLTVSESIIFKGHYCIDTFEAPPDTEFKFGADWGFAQDPSVLGRSYITTTEEAGIEYSELWIDYEAWGLGIELDDIPAFFDSVPESRKWPIKADNSRQETISYVRRQGFSISAADKWDGCVEDGIAHLKAFKMIHIHQRCKHYQDEARLYQYKRDKKTNLVLPIIVDKNNHCWDAERYSLDGYIQRRGVDSVWEKLAR